MKTLECKNCDGISFDCCSGGSTSELFSGLIVTDSVAVTVTKIYRPFKVLYSATEVQLFDAFHNRAKVAFADTVYSNITDLLTFISRCQCTGVIPKGKFASNDLAIAAGLIAGDWYIAGPSHLDGVLEDMLVRVY